MADAQPQTNPRRTRRDLEQENEELWEKLESVYDGLAELFEDDNDEEDDVE